MNAICLNHFNIFFTPLPNREDLVVEQNIKKLGVWKVIFNNLAPVLSVVKIYVNCSWTFCEFLFKDYFHKPANASILSAMPFAYAYQPKQDHTIETVGGLLGAKADIKNAHLFQKEMC